MYLLVQCCLHPDDINSSGKRWAFAAAAYGVCWGISTFGVWLVWELYYEYWRRCRQSECYGLQSIVMPMLLTPDTARPAIEPIYFSLPATLHLSLSSFQHFAFLLHIRVSPLGTSHALDIIPEASYALVQLAPGLLPQLPRVSIGIVLLLSFWRGSGEMTENTAKDARFFRPQDGQLTTYSAATILAFEAYLALRLAVILLSALALLLCSTWDEPDEVVRRRGESDRPSKRDPSRALAPQRSWITREDRFKWDWRERSRRRLQDAFELCLTRHSTSPRKPSRQIAPSGPSRFHLDAGLDFNLFPQTPFYTPASGNTPISATAHPLDTIVQAGLSRTGNTSHSVGATPWRFYRPEQPQSWKMRIELQSRAKGTVHLPCRRARKGKGQLRCHQHRRRR